MKCMKRETPESARLYDAVGKRIRHLRSRRNLTQEALARRAHAARTTITNIENGSQAATLHQLWSIAEVLGVELTELLPSRAEIAAEALDQTRIMGVQAPRTRNLLRTLMADAQETTNG